MAENLTQSIDTSAMLLVLLDLLDRDKKSIICTTIARNDLCRGIPCIQCPLLGTANINKIGNGNPNFKNNTIVFLQEITPLVETINLLNQEGKK